MQQENDVLWLGTRASFDAAVAAERAVQARLQAGLALPPAPDEDDPYLLQRVGAVGVVSIRGPLLNSDNPLLALFGIATYPAIRQALVTAAKDPKIERILLDIDSGGGAVSGVADTAELIKRVDKIKPVTTFASGTMASAAYWLGVSARERAASSTSIVGSIGAMLVHIDASKQLEQEGLKATVIRSGKFKALGVPVEPLSEDGKAQMQAQIDAAYRVFGDHVAASLGMSFESMDKKVGQGREFFGQRALEAGLIDEITSLDAVMSRLAAGRPLDRRRAKHDNGIKGDRSMPQTLTDQDIAALALGSALAPQAAASAAGADAPVVEAAAPAADAPAPVVEAPVADAAAAPVADAAAAPAGAPAASADSEVVAFLRAELKAAQAQLTENAVTIRGLEDKATGMEATHASLLAIARGAVGHLRVALGGSNAGAETLTAEAVALEHAELSARFKDKFKVGGVASVMPEASGAKDQGAVAADPSHKARIAAVRF